MAKGEARFRCLDCSLSFILFGVVVRCGPCVGPASFFCCGIAYLIALPVAVLLSLSLSRVSITLQQISCTIMVLKLKSEVSAPYLEMSPIWTRN
jgi:hypothetical protein